jgi:KaiC/GvpD/RAD55 family RecA-like ATPase
LQELIDRKKLLVIKPQVYKFDSIKQIIGDAIDKIGAKRLVVDSYSVMLTYFSDPYEVRNGLVQLDREIKKMDCTALVISDIKDNSEIFSTTGVEEFIVDGVIVLYLIKAHGHPYESERAITVRKMRATPHPLKTYPFHIGKGGVLMSDQHLTGPVPGSLSMATSPEHRAHGAKKAEKEKPRKPEAGKKEKKPAKKPVGMIDLQNLRSDRQGHSWKWRHL